MNSTYIVTVWTDMNGKMHQTSCPVQAGNLLEAKAKYKATHPSCKSVNGIHKK